MDPKRYTIEHKGKSITVRTCGGPVGAFRGLTNEKIKGWKYLNTTYTLVNGCLVMCLEYPYVPLPN